LTQEAPGKAGHAQARTSPTKVLAERDWMNPHGDCIHFVLLERLADQRPGWQNLTLTATGELSKHSWYFGWNGDRLSNGRDHGRLVKRYPEILHWVLAKLRGAGRVRRHYENRNRPTDERHRG